MSTGIVVLAAAVVAGVLLSVLKTWYDGRFRATRVVERQAVDNGDQLTADDLGAELGERATLLQFSSAFCAPCRATRRVLAEVEGMVDGVRHVEIDAEANLELVRRLNILRTPTVLVLDAAGGTVTRASGAPRKADVIAALGVAVDQQAG
ncbi:thioredoxin family protein [Kribbella sp. DT2]|uniref:thioredoxin family protein n=1 Tax=Kribbella sp. DT2 TaxID=3393427 RepID=UPI003CF746D0